jgi:hypothetical protein
VVAEAEVVSNIPNLFCPHQVELRLLLKRELMSAKDKQSTPSSMNHSMDVQPVICLKS